jgi:HEAT repeat protein
MEPAMPSSVTAAIQALSKIGSIKAKEYLEHYLDSPGEVIHQAAEQALSEVETGEGALSFQPGRFDSSL